MTNDPEIEILGTNEGETFTVSWYLQNGLYNPARTVFSIHLAEEYDPDGYPISAHLKIENRDDVQRIVDHLTTWLNLTKE